MLVTAITNLLTLMQLIIIINYAVKKNCKDEGISEMAVNRDGVFR
ncbi:hypothetical protein P296_01930 [Salmonella enterica subsp. arizonae serovar 18:z4,z23:- str. CVM N26624]|nr:hypothetical protein N898_08380 [Salmonella enterica subsp. arizonae serovar 62:z36:- str. RKS2983]OLV94068.1 hypothetical protein P296_01930 [Salmonella enterica subsp. arizonae serovar 18:z4,z23:- str. CVM N26624]OLW05621.1 hypothetical protein P295_05525 [Salmonella enterica subsp. arizonae serovar 18:z4,z23:- str. CVM N25373]OLW24487.1 hypothetical protein P289_14845 [Salmonella enterica subsp. arizonae serovar 18:z4,z23:- str. CVM N9135]OLW26783.1 hypothetical protein P290_12895 [Salmon